MYCTPCTYTYLKTKANCWYVAEKLTTPIREKRIDTAVKAAAFHSHMCVIVAGSWGNAATKRNCIHMNDSQVYPFHIAFSV